MALSLEMSNEQRAQRLIAQATAADPHRLRLGEIHDEEWPVHTQAVSGLSPNSIYLDDTPAVTPQRLQTNRQEIGIGILGN